MDLLELLKFGRIRGVAPGVSLRFAREMFPRAREERITLPVKVTMVMSGPVEVHAVRGRVVNVVIKTSSLGASWRIGRTGYKVGRRSRLGGIVNALHRVGVQWRAHTPYCTGERLEIMTEGSASLEFVRRSGRLVLNRIHVTKGEKF